MFLGTCDLDDMQCRDIDVFEFTFDVLQETSDARSLRFGYDPSRSFVSRVS